MASSSSVLVKCEVFYQKFLKKHFEWEDNFKRIVFPARHDFNIWLEVYLQRIPENYLLEDYGEETLRIGIPTMGHKDSNVYSYLSQNRQRLLNHRIISYVKMILHEEYRRHKELMTKNNEKFVLKDFIDYLIEEYGWDPDDYERIKKDIDRFRKNELNNKHRNRKKEKQ